MRDVYKWIRKFKQYSVISFRAPSCARSERSKNKLWMKKSDYFFMLARPHFILTLIPTIRKHSQQRPDLIYFLQKARVLHYLVSNFLARVYDCCMVPAAQLLSDEGK